LARHANSMADRLAADLTALGLVPVWPVEANEVFVRLPRRTDKRLRAAGAAYYEWSTQSLPAGTGVAADAVLVRLVTSFATTEADIAGFVAVARARE